MQCFRRSDIMNALKCAGERGMHIPDEFKTVGYDGTLIAKMSYPSMTYISQPIKELADTLVDVLLKKINGAKLSEDIVLEECLSGKRAKLQNKEKLQRKLLWWRKAL